LEKKAKAKTGQDIHDALDVLHEKNRGVEKDQASDKGNERIHNLEKAQQHRDKPFISN